MLIDRRQDLGLRHGILRCASSLDSWRAVRAGTEQLHAMADAAARSGGAVDKGEGRGGGQSSAAGSACARRPEPVACQRTLGARHPGVGRDASVSRRCSSSPTHRGCGACMCSTGRFPMAATAMAARWMTSGEANEIHDVVLLAQPGPVPEILARAAADTGGRSACWTRQAPSWSAPPSCAGSRIRKQCPPSFSDVDTHDVIAAVARRSRRPTGHDSESRRPHLLGGGILH